VRLLALGVGDAFTKRHFSCGAVIEGPEGYLLLECGDLIHRSLHEASERAGWKVDASKIHDILITHLHGDHCNGLESFGFWRMLERMEDSQVPLPRLHINRPASERVWERLAPAMYRAPAFERPGALSDYYDLRILEPDRPSTIAGLTVECRFTKHPVPTTGLLIGDGRSMIGWSSDTPFEPEHVDWLNRADVIIHESNHGPVHTPIRSLNELPDEVRAKIRLTHLPDDFDRSSTDMPILEGGEVVDTD
jgi:ribonuclease BN (tRNA processing enzyme)